MMSGLELKRLAQRVISDDKLPLGHPAKILARAIFTLDDPHHFVRTITEGDPVPKPVFSAHRPTIRLMRDLDDDGFDLSSQDEL